MHKPQNVMHMFPQVYPHDQMWGEIPSIYHCNLEKPNYVGMYDIIQPSFFLIYSNILGVNSHKNTIIIFENQDKYFN